MIGVDFANGIVLLGVPAVLLVPLVVEGLERLGMPAGWATPAAVLVGAVVAGLAETLRIWPETEPVVRIVLAAVVLGFGATGVHAQARALRRPAAPAAPSGPGEPDAPDSPAAPAASDVPDAPAGSDRSAGEDAI